MKTIDFSFTGGFPLDQDALGWLQTGYRDAIAGLYFDAGSTPVILSGMKGSISTTLTPGFFAYNGEVYFCPGGSVSPVPPAPAVPLIYLVETPTAALFEDGSSHNVYIERVGAVGYGTAGPSALDFTTFKTFAQVFGERARLAADPFTSVAVSSTFLTGTVAYRKNYLLNALQLKIDLTVSGGAAGIGNPAVFMSGIGMPTLPAGCAPSSKVRFNAPARSGSGQPLDIGGSDYIRAITCELDSSGNFVLALIKSNGGVNYDISVNLIVPLD